MANDADTQLVLAYFPAFRERDAAWWEQHIAVDFVRHDPGLDFEVRGPAGVAKLAEVLHGAFAIASRTCRVSSALGRAAVTLASSKCRFRTTGSVQLACGVR